MRRRPSSRLLVAAGLTLLAARPAPAQFVARPALDWRTLETRHFTLHYPAEYREWTEAVAARLESARLAVGGVVGFVPEARVQVLVDDPVNAPNGFALPFLDRPTMVFFPVAPSPRQFIGNSRDWGELLAVHEFAHLAHLTRPARRPHDPWRLLPVPTSPLLRRTPRWITEGFATYVEGRVTGSGRPHNPPRAAVLRQWALEGRLPTYGQLNGSGAYNGGAFAYLVGSAYLEWLAARDGDSTVTHLWRRMTARTSRSFADAFTGVYGRTPDDLYRRFTTEVTGAALAVERAIDSAGGPRDGALVQRLAWETGDPAISPDGSRLALVLRSPTRPGRLVVWATADDTVSAADAARRDSARARARRRDPLDVPARRIYPRPRRVLASLDARAGRAFDAPRFMPDGRHVLVTRAEPIADGAYRPDLFQWDTRTGDVRRITRGAAIRLPDPAPDGRSAVALQCVHGWCDVVRVDLATGGVTVMRRGSPTVSYHRPRVSPSGDAVLAAEQRDGRWRLVVLDARDGARVRTLDDSGGGNTFDAAWADSGRTVVAVSDASGIAEVIRIDVASGRREPITRVTGGAFAPEVDPSSGDVFFLALHARGLDLRRLAAPADAVELPRLDPALFPAVPATPRTLPQPLPLEAAPGPDRPYGLGPRQTRWLPGIVHDAGGTTAELLVVNGDPVGRLEVAAVAAVGGRTGWRGGRGWVTVRRWRPALTGELFAAAHEEADGGWPRRLTGGGLRTATRVERGAWHAGFAAGAATMRLSPAADSLQAPRVGATRTTGWATLDVGGGGGGPGRAIAGAARLQGDAGVHAGTAVRHVVAAGAARVDVPLLPAVTVSAAHAADLAATAGMGGSAAFESVTVGGAASPLVDRQLLPQRLPMAALPAGTLRGRSATTARAEVSLGAVTPYAWTVRTYGAGSRGGAAGASGGASGGAGGRWHRVLGAEARMSINAIPVVVLPAVEVVGGIGYSLDAPFHHRATLYLDLAYRP